MWAQIVTAVLGIWLMVAPDLFGFSKNVADNSYIVGPLVATFAIIALSESTRNVRLLNFPIACWLLIAPLVLKYDSDAALINDYFVGVTMILLLLVKPKRKHRFAGGWPAVWKSKY